MTTVAGSSRSHPSADPNAPVKIGIAVVVLAAACVLLLNTFGVISLWGGLPKAPPEAQNVIRDREVAVAKQRELEKEFERLPKHLQPIKAEP